MRKREVTIPWNTMRQGDRFLRYEEPASVGNVVVERGGPALPTHKGGMGYAKVWHAGVAHENVFLIRIAFKEDGYVKPWVAPFWSGATQHVDEEDILMFEERVLAPDVLPGDIRDAIRDGIDEAGLPVPSGGLVTGIERRIWGLYNPE